MRLLKKIATIPHFIKEGIWIINENGLSKTKARIVKDLKVLSLAIKNFKANRTGFQSIALCYFCLMAVVPFIALSFALTNGFGLTGKFVAILQSNLGGNQELINKIMLAAHRIIKYSRSGVVGAISAVTFLWVIIWMMMQVERVFNDIWHVKKSRKLYKKFGVYLIILFLAPFTIMMFFSGSIVYSKVLNNIIPQIPGITNIIKSFLGWVVFSIIVIFIFSMMYKFIPAAYVDYKYALKAAVISGIIFTSLQYLYLETQVMVTRTNAVYGTLAAIPLFMIWLRLGWLIILYGAQFSYSFQKIDNEEIIQL